MSTTIFVCLLALLKQLSRKCPPILDDWRFVIGDYPISNRQSLLPNLPILKINFNQFLTMSEGLCTVSYAPKLP